jgi:hypothetical protein
VESALTGEIGPGRGVYGLLRVSGIVFLCG